MSISSEISRLQTAKAGLKSAIEAKGVTVSSEDTLDDYPALVASISGGGGGSGTVIIEDTLDAAGGTIREITSTDEVHLQSKTVTPTTSQQTITPDSGYDALSQVVVGAASGGVNLDDFFNRTAPTGAVALSSTITKLYGYSFNGNTAITSISAPNVTRLGQKDFMDCSNLTTINFPELEYIGDDGVTDANIAASTTAYAFNNCYALENINIPKLKKCGNWVFGYVGYGKTNYNAIFVLPNLEFTGNTMFRAAKLKAVDLGVNCARINSDSFYSGTYDVVILRSTTLVVAGSRDAVRNIRTMYVPQALVADYATASNWSTDASLRTVLAIEGSQYENYYADGTAIPTTLRR